MLTQNESHNIINLLNECPILVFSVSGPELLLESANAACGDAWNLQNPGIKTQDFFYQCPHFSKTLNQVFSSGKSTSINGFKLIHANKISFYNFYISIKLDQNNKKTGLTIMGVDITEKQNSVSQLETAKFDAELSNSKKSSFLANMSHEIRTPLGVILGFTDLLKEADLTPSQIYGYISIIERNARTLSELVDDILDLSKIEAGKMTLENINFSLNQLLTDVLVAFRMRAKRKNIELSFIARTELPNFINSDPTRLRQILNNMLGNAIKFTEAGKVQLTVSYNGSYLEFEVSDTGCGIKREMQSHLFQDFTQADITISRKYGGTGLGLVLARKLSRALGGEFWLKESKENVGSCFVSCIKINATPGKIEKTNHATFDQVKKLTGYQILLVDDCLDNHELYNIFLKKQGAITHSAYDGQEAVHLAQNENFDLILMDLEMPKLDGLKAIEQLRKNGYHKPVIALTAHAMKDGREKCLVAGFDDILTKPCSNEQLIKKIQSYLHS